MLKKIAATAVLLLVFVFRASAAGQLEETMFRSGKIYTFFVVAMLVLTGIFVYLFRLDIRLNRIEKEMTEKEG